MVTVGDAGNAPDTRICPDESTGFGAVPYSYRIGKFEVTTAQYTAFLNAVAKTDAYGLYDSRMRSSYDACGIQRSGTEGNYTYTTPADRAKRPVNYVSFWRAARFANWLHNGQPNGAQDASTTEDGAYALNGYNDSDGRNIVRNRGAKWWIPNENEWYKAAYYKGGGTKAGYWKYATQSDTLPSNRLLTPDPGNNANFAIPGGTWPPPAPPATTIGAPYWMTEVGAFQNSKSAYGTFDQNGNVFEWCETLGSEGKRFTPGGAWYDKPECLIFHSRAYPYDYAPNHPSGNFGFRVASVAQGPGPRAAAKPGLGTGSDRAGRPAAPMSEQAKAATANLQTSSESRSAGGLAEFGRLIEADVNAARRTDGGTPLMIASQNGHAEVVKLLLAAGADVHAKATIDDTALSLAKETGRTEVVELLKTYGAKE